MRQQLLFLIKALLLWSCCLVSITASAQKHDYNYMFRFSEHSGGVTLSYTDDGDSLRVIPDYRNYSMTSGNPFSDKYGELLFFSNNLHVYDKDAQIIENGEDIFVGGFLPDLYSRDTTVTWGVGQNWLTIPITDSLYYAFHKSAEFISYQFFDLDIEEDGNKLSIYCDGLYLTKIRMSPQGNLYIKPEEKQIQLIDDRLEHNQLLACRHANGKDWWIHQPKVETSDAYIIKLFEDGEMDPPMLQYFSEDNGRVRSWSVTKTNPSGTIIARLFGLWDDDLMHKLELFHFDRCTGETERFFIDSLAQAPINSRTKDIEFSSSGQFLYLANTNNILQFDLTDNNFFENRDTIAVWDGFVINNQPTFYDNLWRLPSGEIVCNNRFSVPYLHVIHNPDEQGILSDFENRAIMSSTDSLRPGHNISIEWLPDFPEYRMPPKEETCTTNSSDIAGDRIEAIVYPNPVSDYLHIDLKGEVHNVQLEVVSATGEIVLQSIQSDSNRLTIPTYDFPQGIYFLTLTSNDGLQQFSSRFIKI